MSTDPLPQRARADQRQGFRRTSQRLIVALVVIAASLGAANAAQGPRLSSVEVNPNALTTRDGQRLLLHLDQPLADVLPDHVTITPAVENTVTVDQNTVTVQFATMLHYNTEYTVTVDVQSSSTGLSGRIEHRFSTSDVDVYSLRRDTRVDANGRDAPDQILRNSLSGKVPEKTVFESPRIQGYVSLQEQLAVVTLDSSNQPSLLVTSPTDGTPIPIDTAGAETIGELQAADTGDTFGYVLDDGYSAPIVFRNRLYLYDLTSGKGVPVVVTGFGDEPLNVMDWRFVPGTTAIVAQAEDQQLYFIDVLSGAEPIPLGGHAEMRGFIPGTVRLVVADPLSGSIIDLANGATTTLVLPEPLTSPDLYPGKLELLSDDSYVLLNTKIDSENQISSTLVRTDTAGSKELFQTVAAGSQIRNFCLSPNGEYLAVEVISGEGVADNYPSVFGYSATSIFFVRVEDGTSNRGVSGFLPHWCSSSP